MALLLQGLSQVPPQTLWVCLRLANTVLHNAWLGSGATRPWSVRSGRGEYPVERLLADYAACACPTLGFAFSRGSQAPLSLVNAEGLTAGRLTQTQTQNTRKELSFATGFTKIDLRSPELSWDEVEDFRDFDHFVPTKTYNPY